MSSLRVALPASAAVPTPALSPTRYAASRADHTGRAERAERAEASASLLRVCPECAGPLVRNSACVNCAHCGWGRCA